MPRVERPVGSWKTICTLRRYARRPRRCSASGSPSKRDPPGVGARARGACGPAWSCRSRTRPPARPSRPAHRRGRRRRRPARRHRAGAELDVEVARLEERRRSHVAAPSARARTRRGGRHRPARARRRSSAHSAIATGQRGWNGQPPAARRDRAGRRAARRLHARRRSPMVGNAAASAACTGAAGRRTPRRWAPPRRSARRTSQPSRRHVSASTDRSWVMNSRARPSSRCSSSSSASTCACTITSSAVVGSSAIEQPRVARQRHRDQHPLALPAGQLVRVVAEPRRRECPTTSSSSAHAAPPCPRGPVCSRIASRDLVADPLHRVQRVHRALEDDRHPSSAPRAVGPASS